MAVDYQLPRLLSAFIEARRSIYLGESQVTRSRQEKASASAVLMVQQRQQALFAASYATSPATRRTSCPSISAVGATPR
jgi:hypothetical protein